MQIKLQWGITSHLSEWPSTICLQTVYTGEGAIALLVGMQTDTATMEDSMEIP